MSDAETLRVYDARADEYAATFSGNLAEDESLAAFLSDVPRGGRILDLGCGPGTWARTMVAAGYVVDATDASAAMVEVAQRDAPSGLRVWRAAFDGLEAQEVYDGVWANFSLLHAPRAEMPGHLARIARALVPGGVVHIGLKEGDGQKRDRLGRYYTYYRFDEMVALVRAAGLRAEATPLRGRDKGLDGEMAPWFTMRAYA